jgi:hypothetical protein
MTENCVIYELLDCITVDGGLHLFYDLVLFPSLYCIAVEFRFNLISWEASVVMSHSQPRPHPHPQALFSLKALNRQAMAVVLHPNNRNRLSTLGGEGVLDVGFHIRSQSSRTLATLGRGPDADIHVEDSRIGRVQCSFEINQETDVIMFYDRSGCQSTQVFGDDAMPFRSGRLRRVVVQPFLNTEIGMGSLSSDLVKFKLLWHVTPTEAIERVKAGKGIIYGQEDNPRLARTAVSTPTSLPPNIRYWIIGGPLGSGTFGTVHKSVDVDTGKMMAVKILRRPTWGTDEEKEFHKLQIKREVKALARINHVSRPLRLP